MNENKNYPPRKQWTVFKKSSMMTLELMQGRYDQQRQKEYKPGLLLSIANGTGDMKYDWEGRQTFAFNITEIGDMLAFMKGALRDTEKLSFYHKKNGNPKSKDQKIFSMTPANNPGKVKYWINLMVEENGNKTQFKNNLSAGEVQVFCTLLQQTAIELCNWKL